MTKVQQPLTKKTLGAILTYCTVQAEKTGPYQVFMVRHVLKADRMDRAELYAWLERRRYRWNGGWWEKHPKHRQVRTPPIDEED